MKVNLSKWQTKVWDDPHRFKVIDVGRRSGKTVLSVLKLLDEALKQKRTVWYISPTYRQSKNIAWSMIKDYIPPSWNATFNETELKVILPNGSEIHLKGADNPDSLRGTKIDFAVFDEVAFFTNWMQVWEALRPILVDSKADCWYVSTPNGMNHFLGLYEKERYDQDYKSFKFTSYDNPYIDKEEIDKAKLEMDELSFNQEFLADFTRPQGTVYSDWPLENFKEVNYDVNLPVHISMDFGINDPTSVIFIQPSGSEYRVIDYYEVSNANIEHFVQYIRSRPFKEAELYTGDVAGNARTLTTGTSPIEIMASKGIFVRTKAGVKIPDQIRLTHGLIKSLYVSSNLTRFRDCLLNYRYPEVKETARNQENELPIHDEFSHAMRALEYYAVNIKDCEPKKYTRMEKVATTDDLGYSNKYTRRGQWSAKYVDAE
jgi:hypothetical protein